MGAIGSGNGLNYFLARGRDAAQRRQFFEEWLDRDPRAAVDALIACGSPGSEALAKENLTEIARKVPSRLTEIVSRLPAPRNFWDVTVQDAFAAMAERGL